MKPPGEHETKIIEGGVTDAVEENKKTTTTTTSVEGKDETESAGVVKGPAVSKDAKADEGQDEDEDEDEDDGPQPPGFRNRGIMSYNSSGVRSPPKPGRPRN